MSSWTRRDVMGLLLGLAVAFLLPTGLRADPAHLLLLTVPAARLAGYMLGVPVTLDAEAAPVLLHPDFPLRVIPGCSGADFIGLLAGLLLWVSFRKRLRTAWLIPLLAWSLTVFANGARLAGLLLVELLIAERLPVYLHNTLHAVTGVAIFLPVLVMTYALWERMVCRERNPV